MRYLKDFIFTDQYLIKGHAHTGGQRLSSFLNSTRKHFLEMEGATFIKHNGGDRIQSEWTMMRVDDILFAYEMEQTGDAVLRNLAVRDKPEIPIAVHLRCDTPMQLSGLVRKRVMDSDRLLHHDFFVMVKPTLQGFTANSAPEYGMLDNIPYLIVNRDRISFITRL